MGSITKRVWKIIDQDYALQSCIARGLINSSALAKYVIEHHGVDASMDGVISALRRYSASKDLLKEHKEIREIIKHSSLSTQTKIASVLVKNTNSSHEALMMMQTKENLLKNDSLHVFKTRQGIYLVFDMRALPIFLANFPKENILSTRENLAQLSLRMPEASWKRKGVLAALTNELSAAGVNILLVSSAYPYITFFVNEESIQESQEALANLTKPM